MSQEVEQRLEQLMEQFEAQGTPVGMKDPLESPAPPLFKSEILAPLDLAQLFTLVKHLQVGQASQQNTLNEMQQQIDLQRRSTAELLSRSQSSSTAIAKFEQIALNTAAAAEQLEAEIIGVRDTCNSMREGASRDMAEFRAELKETRNQHYLDIAELCCASVNNAEQESSSQRSASQLKLGDRLSKQELNTMMEARDLALKEQMTQSLEAAHQAWSNNFLVEHAKLLAEVVGDREKHQEEAQVITSGLDAVAGAHNNAVLSTASNNPSNPSEDGAGISRHLDSMREAVQELRVNMVQDTNADDVETKDPKSEPVTKGSLFEELTIMRKDITSCLDAANAAVRLGEHLTNELHTEVQARCSDMKALRAWAAKRIEAGPGLVGPIGSSRGNADDASLLRKTSDSNSTSHLKVRHSTGHSAVQEDQISAQDKSRGLNIPQSPGIRTFRKAADGMQERPATLESPPADPSVASVPILMQANTFWNSQNTMMPGSGSQNMNLSFDAGGLPPPGIMLSGGSSLARKQQTVPAGERYLANQRLASSQLTPQGVFPPAPGGNNAANGETPRPTRGPSPLKNFHFVHGAQFIDIGQVVDVQDQLRRQQGSPLREPPVTSSRQVPLTVPTIITAPASASYPSGTAILDSSRRVDGSQFARSVSPVQRRISRG